MSNNLDISDRICSTLGVNNFIIGKDTYNMIECINLHNMWKKLISESKSLWCSFHQSSNIQHSENWACTFCWVEHFAQSMKTGIVHCYECWVWIDCAERDVFCWHIQIGQQIECTTFAYVGHTQQTHLQRSSWSSKSNSFDSSFNLWGELRVYFCGQFSDHNYKFSDSKKNHLHISLCLSLTNFLLLLFFICDFFIWEYVIWKYIYHFGI